MSAFKTTYSLSQQDKDEIIEMMVDLDRDYIFASLVVIGLTSAVCWVTRNQSDIFVQFSTLFAMAVFTIAATQITQIIRKKRAIIAQQLLEDIVIFDSEYIKLSKSIFSFSENPNFDCYIHFYDDNQKQQKHRISYAMYNALGTSESKAIKVLKYATTNNKIHYRAVPAKNKSSKI